MGLEVSQDYVALIPPTSYIAIIPGNSMPAANPLPPITPSQVQTLTCDFGYFLPAGVTLEGTPSVTVSDLAGVDPDPEHILDGGATVGTAPLPNGSNVTNAAALQRVQQGVAGAIYLIEVTCPRSDGDTADGFFRIPCVAAH